jgi:hypothetical protein
MSANNDLLNVIDDGNKYGLAGLSIKLENDIPQGEVAPRLIALTDARFEIPSHWREWLGSIRAREVEDCNLFLLSKLRSASPDVLDGENKELQQLV